MNLLNIVKAVSKHATPIGMGGRGPNGFRESDIPEKTLSTDAGKMIVKSAATALAPEFAPITRPLVDKFSEDAKENLKSRKFGDLPECHSEDISPEVSRRLDDAMQKLKSAAVSDVKTKLGKKTYLPWYSSSFRRSQLLYSS